MTTRTVKKTMGKKMTTKMEAVKITIQAEEEAISTTIAQVLTTQMTTTAMIIKVSKVVAQIATKIYS